jgi:hypothetical protein
MNVALTTAVDGRVHALVGHRRPGRPLDLNKPIDEIRRAILRRIDRLERKRAKLDRELRRWGEMARSFNQ